MAKAAELHETETAVMVMKLRLLAALAIPTGKPVVFRPGGKRPLPVGLKAPLRAGENCSLTLGFAQACPGGVTVTVGKLGAMGPPCAGH